ncbi:MAG TPA: cob(I)yrinic acid a,c-diamide adenosyltransferase [Candidatus Omnitrophota bacterium]|nr:cob(I)yrinic acid a,c-diamide adenosyltransferase [Candidatus Omnitrophota bacterium]HQO38715.1 cob(I)yrinic acid a,c-diamide adenosyltransferase [Candidatus Omnitrophota bacterium]HQQ06407.1 cob(I)yrinic acid a,c-diamide adenosyltransferase [Candidatus Omnitrophota bacterium]
MIHIYTGNGKGKTTAAIGLAIRAAGACKKVFIGQFIKGRPYSELQCLKKIKFITVEQFGRGCFIRRAPARIDVELARKGLARSRDIIKSRAFDIVILDEIHCALAVKLLRTRDILDLIHATPRRIELVLTGRSAPRALINAADLVSEVREIKHYYRKGIQARKGIEF